MGGRRSETVTQRIFLKRINRKWGLMDTGLGQANRGLKRVSTGHGCMKRRLGQMSRGLKRTGGGLRRVDIGLGQVDKRSERDRARSWTGG